MESPDMLVPTDSSALFYRYSASPLDHALVNSAVVSPVNRRPTRRRGLLTHLVGLFAVASSISTPGRAQTVAEVQVTPETMTLGVGQKQALFATAFDPRGNLIPAAKFTFWSSDSLIAAVRKDGTVVGLKPGLAKIEARSQGKRASLAVLITGTARSAPTASVLTLEPATVLLLPGESVRIMPQALRE